MTLDSRPKPAGYGPPAAALLDGNAPDEAHVAPEAARVFYAIDSRRVTLGECWRSAPSGILGFALTKFVRVRVPSSTDDPCVESLAPFEVSASEVPGTILQRSSVVLHQLASLGFHGPIWHVIEDDVNQTKTYLATMPHDSGRTWARVHHRAWHLRAPAKTSLFAELVTETVDGNFIWSRSSKPDLDAPDSCTVIRDVGAPVGRLMAAHRKATTGMIEKRVRAFSGADELRAAVERHHAAVRDHHLTRRVFAPLSADERQSAAAFRTTVKSAEAEGSRHPEIVAEVDRIQNAKSSRANGVLLLIASLVLFVGSGMMRTGGSMSGYAPGMLGIIVVVLFVHELGHWVAMRIFGYRNMKMFFIPFFGAAVSGRHYNVAGWKKAIVSLMGPLPGIAIGAGLGWLGITLHQPMLVKVSLVALILNGFNLLPILPLDGGWIVQAILFSRHHLLELAFRIAALAGLFLLSVLSGSSMSIGLAVGTTIALPAMYKLSRITNELRRARLPAASDDGQTLPLQTADAIIGRIKAAFPAKLSNKAAARYTLQIFENLNARPPGMLASLGLGVLQFGSMAGVVVASILIFTQSKAGTWHDVRASGLAVVRTPGDSALATSRNLLVADFASPNQVATATAAAAQQASPDAAIERFGQTLLVSLPLEDVDGLREVQTVVDRQGATSYVAVSDDEASVRLSCTAPSTAAAGALERELAGYLAGTGLHLVAPWHPDTSWTADERARYGRTRATFGAVEQALTSIDHDPAVLALQRQAVFASVTRNAGKLTALRAQYAELVDRLRRERIAAVRRDPAMDGAVIDSVAAIGFANDLNDVAPRGVASVAPMLGTLPLVDGRPAPGTDEWTAAGSVEVEGTKLSLPLRFTNAFQGAPAVVRWLAANGCGQVKYNLVGGVVHKPRVPDLQERETP